MVWLAAHMERSLRKQAVQDVSIEGSVNAILATPGSGTNNNSTARPNKKQRRGDGSGSSVVIVSEEDGVGLALRLSGQLLLGVVRIYSRKAMYLLQVCV